MGGDASTSTAELSFTVLGPVRAWRDGHELELGSPQQRAVFTLLLLRAGHPVTAEELVDAVWGEDPPKAAVGAVRTYISRLRQTLEPDRPADTPWTVLSSTGHSYTLHIPATATDIGIVEQRVTAAAAARAAGELAVAAGLLREAVEQFRGVPLAGLSGPFTGAHRARLAQRRLGVLESRIELDLDLGRHAEVVAELSTLVTEYPLREGLAELLMLALYRSGRQAEALAVYTDTRRLLADELGVDPGPALRQLHQRILNADPTLAGAALTGAAAPAGPPRQPTVPRPAQLPTDLADFTGRGSLVAALSDQLITGDGRAVALSAVAGIGGVGKTALAVHVAHAVRDQFPAGQLYVDLHGVDDRPTDPGVALGGFLRALGIPEPELPQSTEERSALFRSKLADRRVLVLLDNARDAAQVRPLLPGSPTCAVVITSRARMTDLPGAMRVDLDVLDPDEALALFAAIVGQERVSAERAAAVDVVAACGFLPLAVRIVASRLEARPMWTIAALATRLANTRRRLAELRAGDLAVEASFELSFRQLAPEHSRAFRLLAVPEGGYDVSLPCAAALIGATEDDAEPILEHLVDLSLLETTAPGHYRHHDLLRLFAQQRTEQANIQHERSDALNRLLDFYLATTTNGYRTLEPGQLLPDVLTATESSGLPLPDHQSARDWADSERGALLATLGQIAGDPAGNVVKAADLLLVINPVLEAGFHWAAVLEPASAVVRAAEERGELRAAARARNPLGYALGSLGQFAEGEAEIRRATALHRESQDWVPLTITLNSLGALAYYVGRDEEAIEYFTEALEVASTRCPGSASGYNLVGLAVVYGRRGDVAAIDYAERGLAIGREAGGKPYAYALYTFGKVLEDLGRWEDAISRYTECLALYRTSGDEGGQSEMLFQLANCQRELGQFTEAIATAEQSLALAEQLGAETNRGHSLASLGRTLAKLGRTERSQVCLREAAEILAPIRPHEAEELRALLEAR